MLLFMIITDYFQTFIVYLSKQIQADLLISIVSLPGRLTHLLVTFLKCALPKLSSCDEMDNFKNTVS